MIILPSSQFFAKTILVNFFKIDAAIYEGIAVWEAVFPQQTTALRDNPEGVFFIRRLFPRRGW